MMMIFRNAYLPSSAGLWPRWHRRSWSIRDSPTRLARSPRSPHDAHRRGPPADAPGWLQQSLLWQLALSMRRWATRRRREDCDLLATSSNITRTAMPEE